MRSWFLSASGFGFWIACACVCALICSSRINLFGARSLLHVACCLLPAACCMLPVACCLFRSSLFSMSYFSMSCLQCLVFIICLQCIVFSLLFSVCCFRDLLQCLASVRNVCWLRACVSNRLLLPLMHNSRYLCL